MSNEFDILKYLNPNPDGWLRRRHKTPFTLSSFHQNIRSDDADQDAPDDLLRRHLRPNADASTIVVSPVRIIRTLAPVNAASRNIVLQSVRPYAKSSHTTSYWQDAGWQERGEYLIGHYVAGDRRFAGSIERKASIVEPGRYYIYAPPAAVLAGPHGACFRFQGKSAGLPKYWIHFSEEPADIDSGIIQIQRDLATAIGAA